MHRIAISWSNQRGNGGSGPQWPNFVASFEFRGRSFSRSSSVQMLVDLPKAPAAWGRGSLRVLDIYIYIYKRYITTNKYVSFRHLYIMCIYMYIYIYIYLYQNNHQLGKMRNHQFMGPAGARSFVSC